jgi:hypothetical protein
MPTTHRSLRLQAVVLPLLTFIVLLELNGWALRQEKGPQDPAFWLFAFVVSIAVIAVGLASRATTIGASPWRTIGIALASATVCFSVAGAFMPRVFGERSISVGDRGSGPGEGFSQSVGARFRKPALDSALASAERLNGVHAFDQFTCGDRAPTFRFELTLHPQGELNERYVSVAYAPAAAGNENRCLSFGISYLIDSVFSLIDTGPRVKYGYVNPSTGQSLPEAEPRAPRKPVCRCDLRHSGGEWVAHSPAQAAALRADTSRHRR